MRLVLVAAVAAGCAYDAGTFHSTVVAFDGTRATIGCIDVAVSRAQDSYTHGALVQLTFGNRCEHRVTLDLVHVRATAHGVAVAPWDPRGELVVAPLPARMIGQETFEYRQASPDEQVCVDIGGIDADIPAVEKVVCP